MTWDELVFRPLTADPFIYKGTGDVDPVEEPGGGEVRSDVEMRGRSTDRGSNEIVDPFDPGSGGSGGQGGQAPCWENTSERCWHSYDTTFPVATGRYFPAGELKLGTLAINWNRWSGLQYACGSGPDTINTGSDQSSPDEQERVRIAYFQRLRDLGFRELVIPFPQWFCGEDIENTGDPVARYVRDIELAKAAGFSCNEIQLMFPGQFCDCMSRGVVTPEFLGSILDRVVEICGENIMGIYVDEPDKKGNVCANHLATIRRLADERGIPLFLSGYYTNISPWEDGGTFGDNVHNYASGGVSYSGYHKVYEITSGDLTLSTGFLMGLLGPVGIVAGIIGLAVVGPLNAYRRYLSSPDVPTNAWEHMMKEFNRGDDFILFPWANPVYDHFNTYLKDAKMFKRLYFFADDIFYGNVDNRIDRGIWKQAQRCCVEVSPDTPCDHHNPAFMNCYRRLRYEYCREYWTGIEDFIQAAVKEGWLVPETEDKTITVTSYCKKRNCDDCDPGNPSDWIDHPLLPCDEIGRTQPDENQWWSDPIIG